MAVARNVCTDLTVPDIVEYLVKTDIVCDKLVKAVGGDVYVCKNTDDCVK